LLHTRHLNTFRFIRAIYIEPNRIIQGFGSHQDKWGASAAEEGLGTFSVLCGKVAAKLSLKVATAGYNFAPNHFIILAADSS
jgi:hypothetical protein